MQIFEVSKAAATMALDLNDLVVQHPAATYFVRADGDVCDDATGIAPGDILVVDRALEPRNEKLVVAIIDGNFVVRKYLVNKKEKKPTSFQIFGVVTFIIRKL